MHKLSTSSWRVKKFLRALPITLTVVAVVSLAFISQETAQASVAIPSANPGIATATDSNANQAVAAFLNRILTLIFVAAIPVAMYGIVITATNLLRSPGDPAGYQKVKKNLISILIGFVLLTTGSVAVRFVISILTR
jgi:hypothetical protein